MVINGKMPVSPTGPSRIGVGWLCYESSVPTRIHLCKPIIKGGLLGKE